MAGRVNLAYFHPRTACPVCQSTDVELIYSAPLDADPVRSFIASQYHAQGLVNWLYFTGTDFDVLQCRRCDLIYQGNVPGQAVLDHLYYEMIAPAALERIERELLTIENFHHIAGEMAVLFRMTGKHPSEVRFLDYGFGHGRWARVARAMGAQVFATETGDEKRVLAKALGIKIVDDQDIDTMRFDIVHTEQVLEHLSDPGRDFHRLARATEGVMKVAVPARGKLRALLAARGMPAKAPFSRYGIGARQTAADNAITSIQPLEHLNAFSPRTMRWLAAENAMTITSTVRRRAIAMELDSPSLFARSAARLAMMLAKTMLRPDLGYYILRPARADA